MNFRARLLVPIALLVSACAPAAQMVRVPIPKFAMTPEAIATATGGKPEFTDGVIRVSFPRMDVQAEVDGAKLPPFLGLTSWVAFGVGKANVEAMVMGDLVLLEDEVNPVMRLLLDSGISVTALHNHFFFDKPKILFLHIGGEGAIAELGGGVKRALAKVQEIRLKTPVPATSFGPAFPATSALDAAKLEAALGVKGTAKDGMFKAVIGRETSAECGCSIGKAMGVNTWAGFGGTDDDAVVDGDFAVLESELQPVLKSLRASAINIVAIHHHMTGELPRILFLHYWGRGRALDLAAGVKRALDLTAGSGPPS
jgi:hypothetical protein